MKEYNSLQAEYKLIWTQNPKRLGYLQSLFTKELCQLWNWFPSHSTPTSVPRTQATYHWFQVCCYCGGSVGGVCVKESDKLLEERQELVPQSKFLFYGNKQAPSLLANSLLTAKILTQVTKCFQSQKDILQKQTDHREPKQLYRKTHIDSSVKLVGLEFPRHWALGGVVGEGTRKAAWIQEIWKI